MPTHTQVLLFFSNFGLKEGKEPPTLTFRQYRLVVITAARWHGAMFAQWVADCFMPTGYATEPGYDDSLSHYIFHHPQTGN